MDRRFVIIALVVVLTLLALTLTALASGAGSPTGNLRPSMSGEFAHMQLASLHLDAAPWTRVPADSWRHMSGPRRAHLGHRHAAWA